MITQTSRRCWPKALQSTLNCWSHEVSLSLHRLWGLQEARVILMALSILASSWSHRQCQQTLCSHTAGSAATLQHLRTWQNQAPCSWLQETSCTLHSWRLPTTAVNFLCWELGASCPQKRGTRIPNLLKSLILAAFPNPSFHLVTWPWRSKSRQKDTKLPGVHVWYMQVGSKTNSRKVMQKVLQRLVKQATRMHLIWCVGILRVQH